MIAGFPKRDKKKGYRVDDLVNWAVDNHREKIIALIEKKRATDAKKEK